MIKLRPWQDEALRKSLQWLVHDKTDRHFLINAAPGAGKTIAACTIANELFIRNEIDRVIIIAPRKQVVSQWADDFFRITGRGICKVTGMDGDIDSLGSDICATWAAMQGLLDAIQAVCQKKRVLVICDEHHHAAVEAAWGDSADSAFANAKFALILTGTPIRSDGAKSIWLAYDDGGAINHPEGGTYTLTYGEAVKLGYCRPATFHRHEGLFDVKIDNDSVVRVSGQNSTELPTDLSRVSGLRRALNFYQLACTPQYEKDNKTPKLNGYQATMLESAGQKLNLLRYRMPNAGGLVIAPSIEMAEYMSELIEKIEGEKPIIVHSEVSNPQDKIKAFRNNNKRWLVSVAMVSEGVDIKRLRVLVYLSNALTELSFRQAIGRVVRTSGYDDDTHAYIVMPDFDILDAYALRVEQEMPSGARKDPGIPKSKRCPACSTECPLNTSECPECGYEFSDRSHSFKTCHSCQALNPISAKLCQACGASFTPEIEISLEQALRNGVIVRGMEIDEDEAVEAEKIAPGVRKKILKSGDANLIKIMQWLPEQSILRFSSVVSGEYREQQDKEISHD